MYPKNSSHCHLMQDLAQAASPHDMRPAQFYSYCGQPREAPASADMRLSAPASAEQQFVRSLAEIEPVF
jgi:hypothetical protein